MDKSFSTLLNVTTLGDHLMHHLFPTVDHSKLAHLYPALWETCREFGAAYRLIKKREKDESWITLRPW